MDFVVGYEIKTSNNHPDRDICDELKGKYPKDFVFKGWHPQCRCYVVPILAEQDEFVNIQKKILESEDPTSIKSVNTIKRPGQKFYDWWDANKERVETASSMPYWVQDNQDYINKKRKIKVKTEEEREAIRKKWAERSKKYTLITKMANNVLKVAKEYPEIDLTALQSFIDNKNITSMNNEARTVAKQIVEIRKDEKALSVLIPDVHEWKKQFTSAELHEVYDAVEKKLAQIDAEQLNMLKYNNILEQKKALLEKEIKYVSDPNYLKLHNLYPTWPISHAAYAKRLEMVLDEIEWEKIGNVLNEALTFKTKSKPYLTLIDNLKTAVTNKDKVAAKSIVVEMEVKRVELKKASDARARKKSNSVFNDDAYSKNRKDAALWTKTKDKCGLYDRQSGDDYFRPFAEGDWKRWDDNQKDVAYLYTSGSSYINEPLYTKYYSTKYGLKGEVRDSWKDINTLTDMIDKSTPFTRDVWLNRGASAGEFFGQFGIDLYSCINNPDILIGKTGEQKAFMSTAHSKSWGFIDDGGKARRDVVYNIYCPKGTKGIYTEPYSAFGSGGRDWNGKDITPLRNEVEVILQRSTRLRVIKAEYKNGQWFIDMEVIGQPTF